MTRATQTIEVENFWGTPQASPPGEYTEVFLAGEWRGFRLAGRGSATMGHGAGTGFTTVGMEVDGIGFVSSDSYEVR